MLVLFTAVELDIVPVDVEVSIPDVELIELEESEIEGKTISHEVSNSVSKPIGTNKCFFNVFTNLILSLFILIVLRYTYEQD